jgi:hypothetical protein
MKDSSLVPVAFIGFVFLSFNLLWAADDSRFDAYGGFSVVNGAGMVQPGWNAAATIHLNKCIGIKFDFAGSYDSNIEEVGSQGVIIIGPGSNPTTLTATHRQYTYLVGPQLRFKAGHNLEPFAHVLLGATREKFQRPGITISAPIIGTLLSIPALNHRDSALAVAFGGGMDYRLSRSFSWRLISLDYQMDNAFGSTTNRMRFSTGLVYGLGKVK